MAKKLKVPEVDLAFVEPHPRFNEVAASITQHQYLRRKIAIALQQAYTAGIKQGVKSNEQ